jgi:hypothetical protein
MNTYSTAFVAAGPSDGAEGLVQNLAQRADAFSDQLAMTDGVDAGSIDKSLSQSSATVFSHPENGAYVETTYTIFVRYEAIERHLPGEMVKTKPAGQL